MWNPVTGQNSRIGTALTGWLFIIPSFVTTVAVTVIIGCDVVLRYVFNTPLLWSIEANELLLIVMVFSAMPYVWERRAHVHMELLQPHFPPWLKRIADVTTGLAGLAFSGLLMWQMWRNTFSMMQDREGAEELHLPFWPFALFISFIGLVMSLQFIVCILRALAGRSQGSEGA